MMDEKELLRIVRTLTYPSDDVSGDELEELTELFEKSVSHPAGAGLLHYPEDWGLSANPSPEEIVKEAVSWRPRILAMTVTYVRKHPRRVDLFCVGVEVKGQIQTQIVSALKLKPGDVCAVALSGMKLHSGKTVKHGFVDRVYTAGEILALTDQTPGVEFPASAFPEC